MNPKTGPPRVVGGGGSRCRLDLSNRSAAAPHRPPALATLPLALQRPPPAPPPNLRTPRSRWTAAPSSWAAPGVRPTAAASPPPPRGAGCRGCAVRPRSGPYVPAAATSFAGQTYKCEGSGCTTFEYITCDNAGARITCLHMCITGQCKAGHPASTRSACLPVRRLGPACLLPHSSCMLARLSESSTSPSSPTSTSLQPTLPLLQSLAW